VARSDGVVVQPALGRVADVWGYAASYLVAAAIEVLAVLSCFLPEIGALPPTRSRYQCLRAKKSLAQSRKVVQRIGGRLQIVSLLTHAVPAVFMSCDESDDDGYRHPQTKLARLGASAGPGDCRVLHARPGGAGGDVSSVQKDRARSSQPAAFSRRPSSVHELKAPTGTVIREYVTMERPRLRRDLAGPLAARPAPAPRPLLR